MALGLLSDRLGARPPAPLLVVTYRGLGDLRCRPVPYSIDAPVLVDEGVLCGCCVKPRPLGNPGSHGNDGPGVDTGLSAQRLRPEGSSEEFPWIRAPGWQGLTGSLRVGCNERGEGSLLQRHASGERPILRTYGGPLQHLGHSRVDQLFRGSSPKKGAWVVDPGLGQLERARTTPVAEQNDLLPGARPIRTGRPVPPHLRELWSKLCVCFPKELPWTG